MDLGRVGRAVRALRRRRGWTQAALGGAAGVSGPTVGRIVRGTGGSVPLHVLDRVVRELGGSLEVTVRWNGAELDRLVDAAHARLVETVVALLRGYGWEVGVEVSFSIWGERGSIDVVGRRPGGALAIVEVKGTMGEAHATLSVLDCKGRLAPAIARERGWRAGLRRCPAGGRGHEDEPAATRRPRRDVRRHASGRNARGPGVAPQPGRAAAGRHVPVIGSPGEPGPTACHCGGSFRARPGAAFRTTRCLLG